MDPHHFQYLLQDIEILMVSWEDRTIHSGKGTHPFLDQKTFNRMIEEARKNIGKRYDPLERFEYWEIPDNDPKKIAHLLMSRARNKEEKDLIRVYKEKIQ